MSTSFHAQHDLSLVPLFTGLRPGQLERIGRTLRRKTLAAGQSLLALGHKSEEIYFLLEGTVKVSIPQPKNGGCVINVCGPGAVLGEVSALDGGGYSADVTTIETCRLLWMQQATFVRYLGEMPRLGLNLARVMARRLRHNCVSAQLRSRLGVRARLAGQLLDFARLYENISAPDERGESIRLPLGLSQSDWAVTIGSSRQSVNSTLARFQREGLVVLDEEHQITILDRAALTAYYNS
jgi:CRP-like cAMP-binding protein